MKILLDELRRSWNRQKVYWVLMCVIFTLSISTIYYIYTDIHGSYIYNKAILSDLKSDFKAYDTWFYPANETEHNEFFRNDEMFQNVLAFYHALQQDPSVQVFNCDQSALFPSGEFPDVPESFLNGYVESEEPTISDIPIEFTVDTVGLSTVCISPNVYDLLGLTLYEGHTASEISYIHEKDKPVEVVLGYEYRGYFKMGDSFMAMYNGESLTLQIVGFLDPGAQVPRSLGGGMTLLDRSILLPSFDTILSVRSSNITVDEFTRYVYSEKAFPSLLTDMDTEEVIEWVNAVAIRTGSFEVICQPIAMTGMEPVQSFSYQDFSLTMILVGLVIFVVISTIAILSATKFNTNLPTYAIYLITGGSPLQIFVFMAVEILLLFIPAVMCAYLIILQAFAGAVPFSYLMPKVLVVAGGIYVVTLIPCSVLLRKLSLSQLIRRKRT